MRSTGLLLLLGILAVAGACGDDDGDDDDTPIIDGGNVDGAPPDAPGPDATPPSPYGLWRLVGVTLDDGMGGTIALTDIDQQVMGVDARINGILHIREQEGDLGVSLTNIIDDGIGGVSAQAFSATINGTWTTMTVDGNDVPISHDATGPIEKLTVNEGVDALEFVRYVHVKTNSITVTGTVSLAPGTTVPLSNPRVGLVSLLRKAGGGPGFDFTQVASLEADSDKALPAGFGDDETDTAEFTLVRNVAALGIERIEYGNVGIAVSLVVMYEDRDGNGKLDRIDVDACPMANVDCVRGVSPVAIAYRAFSSPELEASPFDLLLEGWAPVVTGDDERGAMVVPTLLPLDPTTEPFGYDIFVPADPTSAQVPALAF